MLRTARLGADRAPGSLRESSRLNPPDDSAGRRNIPVSNPWAVLVCPFPPAAPAGRPHRIWIGSSWPVSPVARLGAVLAPRIQGDRHHNSALARAQGRAASVECLPECPPRGFKHARIAGVSLRVGRCCGSLGNRQRRWSGREDLNLRPHRPERCALPGCATPRGKPEYRRPTHHPTQLLSWGRGSEPAPDPIRG